MIIKARRLFAVIQLKYMPEVTFAFFAFCRPSIIAPADSNGIDFSDNRSRGGGEEDENFPSFEEVMLGVGGAQESQQPGLRLGEVKNGKIDGSNSVHSRSDGSTSEQREREALLFATLHGLL